MVSDASFMNLSGSNAVTGKKSTKHLITIFVCLLLLTATVSLTYMVSGVYGIILFGNLNFVNLGTLIVGFVQILFVLLGIRSAKRMGKYYERPLMLLGTLSFVKIIGFVVVALNAIFESSLLEENFTESE